MDNSFVDSINRLKANFTKPLPGISVQYDMAPVTRKEQLVYTKNTIPPRKSAVLALLYPENDEVMLVLMKRAEDQSVHSGQISFPGGQAEPFDVDDIATALRETEEELGIDKELIHIIGKLTPVYISPSNFNVIPFVGFMNDKPVFHINEEVDRVITVSLSDLLAPGSKVKRKVNTRYVKDLEVPCFLVEGEILWGATAMMINELLEIYKAKRPPYC